MNYCEENDIYYIGEYHSYRICGEYNPNFSKVNGGYILDLKENKESGLNYYKRKIKEELEKWDLKNCDIITIVPSSKQNKVGEGLVSLVKSISEDYNIEYIQCLNRNRDVKKKANGGLRSRQLELDTIDAINIERIEGANILLFDDVTTTGTSLNSTREILYANGANKVVCIALGKTV